MNPIKPPPRGNKKLGEVLTESRPTAMTCPSTCAFLRSGECYSLKGERYHPGIIDAWESRDDARQAHRPIWRSFRASVWRKETAAGRPVRFLVHGDLLKQHRQEGKEELDRNFLADIIRTAHMVPGFKGWGYTHAWRMVPRSTLRALRHVGITLWASCHNRREAKMARSRGFPVAFIDKAQSHGYSGPKMRTDIGTGRPAVICPEQIGTKASCLDCGFCWNGQAGKRADLVLLSH